MFSPLPSQQRSLAPLTATLMPWKRDDWVAELSGRSENLFWGQRQGFRGPLRPVEMFSFEECLPMQI